MPITGPAIGLSPVTAVHGRSADATRVHHLLWRAAEKHPTRTAVRDLHGAWTYRELQRESLRFASLLFARGIPAGSRVVIRMSNSRASVAALYGCSIAGTVAVPLNPRMKPFHLEPMIADVDPALVVGGALAGGGRAAWDPETAWSTLPEPAVTEVELPSSGLTHLLYTSGSTAAPKAVRSPAAAVIFAAGAIQKVLGYQPGDVVFCRIPLSFDYGLYQIFLCALAGAELLLTDSDRDTALLADIRACGATVVPLVPSLARMLAVLGQRDAALTSVRLFTNTGETIPGSVITALRARFPAAKWHLMYGITECKRVSIMEKDGDLAVPGAVGRPLPDTEVLIVDPDGRPLPPGTVGEIVVRGPHVMAGYWNAPELTARFFRDGALLTGDFGHLDASGYLFLEGRRDSIYKQNGIRTSVEEVEAAARDMPGVWDAVLVPPDEGHEAVLCLVTEMSVAQVQRGLHDRLEAGKVPQHLRIHFSFPLTDNGKLDRHALARMIGTTDA